MNTISILPETDDETPATFRAFTKDLGATGRTPGEALDALTSRLGAGGSAAVIVQTFSPDKHFSSEQRERLSALMTRWRAARDSGGSVSPADEADLEMLVEEELRGSAGRAAQLSRVHEESRRVHFISPEEIYEVMRRLDVEAVLASKHYTFGLTAVIFFLAFAAITLELWAPQTDKPFRWDSLLPGVGAAAAALLLYLVNNAANKRIKALRDMFDVRAKGEESGGRTRPR